MKLTEKQIESQILSWLNLQQGIFAFKVNTVGVYDAKQMVYRMNKNKFILRGTSDILGVIFGRFFAIEVKTPKTKSNLSLDQKIFLDQIKRYQGFSFVAWSLDQVIEWVNEIKKTIH